MQLSFRFFFNRGTMLLNVDREKVKERLPFLTSLKQSFFNTQFVDSPAVNASV